MAKKTLKCDVLSLSSIKKLQDSLKAYSDSLTDKCERVVRELADIGLKEAERQISKAGYTYEQTKNNGYIESGSNTDHYSEVKVTTLNGYSRADLIVNGKDIAFIEFGSGVHYNGAVGQSPNPDGQKLGMVIGSYGKGNGKEDVWGYYAESGELILSHGTKATMPMYNATMKMYKAAPKVVKQVFGK
jgi:hypothetical protein